MSRGEDIRVSYYSAVLARAIRLEDGDAFTDLYDQIVRLVTKEQADLAVDRARDFSNLALPTLENKIKWLESLGVNPIKASTPRPISVSKPQTSKLSSPTEYIIEEQIFYESENSMSDNSEPFSCISSDKPNLQKLYERTMLNQPSPADRVMEFIDDNDGELTRSSAQQIPIVASNHMNSYIDKNDNEQEIRMINNKQIKSNRQNTVVEQRDVIIELPETAVDFGLPGFHQQKNPSFAGFSDVCEKRYVDIEMKNLCGSANSTQVIHSRQGNPETVLHPMQSADSDDDGSEASKKVKKKKKRKPKPQGVTDPLEEINAECEIDKLNFSGRVDEKSGKSSRNSRRKKFNEARKTCNSLECPNIKTSSCPMIVDENKPIAEEKPKKRTIKRFQEERGREQLYDNPPHSKDEVTALNSATRRTYGAIPKKHEEWLDDEAVNKILKELGEEAKISSEAKKKSKDIKKDKKKNKKQKKSDKDRSKEEVNETSGSLEAFHPIKEDCEIYDGKVASGDEREFVTQKKSRKSGTRTTQSGRSSPHEQETRRCPGSPTNHHSIPEPGTEQPYHDPIDDVQTSGIHVYDGEQWPTLPAALSANLPQSSVSNRCGASSTSYASKLKSNLDSTGCSLASSSEDGASSSSSSSGGGVAGHVPGRISPSNDMEFQLPDILSGVSSAVAATTKLMKSFSKPPVKSENPLPPLQPACVNRKPAPVVEVATMLSKDISTVVITKLNTTNDKVQPDLTPSEIAANTDSQESQQNDGTGNFKTLTDYESEKHMPKDVIEIFENQWGLEFIMEDPSVGGDFVQIDDSTVFKQISSTTADKLKAEGKLTFECTFGNTKDIERLPVKIKTVKTIGYNMRRREDNAWLWNHPCKFDVDSAANFFLKEWNTVAKRATYYQEQ